MAIVPDITKAELIAELTDSTVADWWTASDALPANTDMSELLAKTLLAAYVAQVKKNTAATPEIGEALAAYSAPVTSTVAVDTEDGTQSFTSTYSLSIESAVGIDLSVPARI